ncbi:vicilin-like seed storage protein At2g18540 [Brassica napus]|uniref:vicilin-like seed storage protein At2g18540 n=1 Tax=Brassica napus TaxID=3708 RepID=UPI002079C631|nr:vicilin-like seed storage protein At2g18540 [Brassica napus]
MKKKVKRKRLKPVTKRKRTVRMMRKLKKKWWNLRLKAKMIKQREQDKEKSETDEVESEAREAEIEKGTPTPPRGNQTEGTPTPPRGRTKAMAARRLVTRTMEGEPGKGVEVVAEEACETEEKSRKKAGETEGKSRKKVAEEEKKEEEAVKVVEEQAGEVVEEQAGEIVEEYTEEEKQRLIMVVYKEAPSPWIMHRCKENAAVAVPKKSGRPKEITVGADSFHGGEEA